MYVRQPYLDPIARLEDSQDHNPSHSQSSGVRRRRGSRVPTASDPRVRATSARQSPSLSPPGRRRSPSSSSGQLREGSPFPAQPARLVLVVFKETKEDYGHGGHSEGWRYELESNYPGYDSCECPRDEVQPRAGNDGRASRGAVQMIFVLAGC